VEARPSVSDGRGRSPGGFEAVGRLQDALEAAVGDPSGGESVEIVDRRSNSYASTFPSEIVRCRVSRLGAGPSAPGVIALFAKRGPAYRDPHSGHARGVPYEIEMYRRVLPLLSVARPKLLGAFQEPGPQGEGWLFIEHLADTLRVDETADPQAIRRAAEELAALHSGGEGVVARSEHRFLNSYGAPYLEEFARRWRGSVTRLSDGHAWIEALSRRMDDVMDYLGSSRPTVVHGEAYVNNILLREGRPVIVDWESAGTGPGEIDLATLLARWPEEEAREAEAAYVGARWPDGPPDSFALALQAARLHALARILHRHLYGPGSAKQIEIILTEIRVASERLGVL
jgi:aminoglycoside phosphotransferase (APT) family kinase protein